MNFMLARGSLMSTTFSTNTTGVLTGILSSILTLMTWSYFAGGKIAAQAAQIEQNRADIQELRLVVRKHLDDQVKIADFMHSINTRLARLSERQEIQRDYKPR